MNYTFTPLEEPKYQQFKEKVSKYQTNIIGFVSISGLRAQGLDRLKVNLERLGVSV